MVYSHKTYALTLNITSQKRVGLTKTRSLFGLYICHSRRLIDNGYVILYNKGGLLKGVTLTNNEEVYYQNPSIQTLQGEYQPTGIDVTANNKNNGEILQNVSGHILYHFQLTTIPQASKEVVTYVYLPYYLTKSGEWEQAVFETSINEGWVLTEDGRYVMYTQQVSTI